ncbi:hypothetical protein ACFY12_34215 [Streptomyces sp. NPDC001339]
MLAAIGATAVIQDPAASDALRRAQEAAEAAARAAAERARQSNG